MLEFKVPDMSCNHCIASITKAVNEVAPDAAVQADLDTRRVTVTGTADQAAVLSALSEIGFDAQAV